MTKKTGVGFLLSLVFVVSTCSSAFSETYVGGGLGLSFAAEADSIKASQGAIEASSSDLDGDDSFAYGFKVGHYFNSLPWLGVEFNLYQREPDADQQGVTVTGATAGLIRTDAGQAKVDVEHLTTAGLLVMLRATEEQTKNMFNMEPYVGIGLGVNAINLSEGTAYSAAGAYLESVNLSSDVSVGILLSAGLNYDITDQIKAYGEYKYTEASYDMSTNAVNYSFDVDDSTMMFGVSYALGASNVLDSIADSVHYYLTCDPCVTR